MEEGWYSQIGVKQWDAVFYADMEDFIEKMALKNSRI